MTRLELSVPPVSQAPLGDLFKPQAVRRWLDDLPKVSEAQTFDAVFAKLQEVNRVALPPAQRFQLAECFIADVEYLADHLCRRCEQQEFPAAENERRLSARVQDLLAEMAFGYKHVLLGLAGQRVEGEALVMTRDALLRLMRLLALRVLQAYVVYAPPPPELWGELHRLYRYAERIDVARTRVEHLADQSVGDIYKRALLLALANPFHLMQGEARSTFDRLAKWALACGIRHPAEFADPPERLYAKRWLVDLDGDAPPSFGLLEGQAPPRDARLLDLQPVARIVEDRIRQMTLKGQLPMRERMERDLLRRLRNAWSGRPARAAERQLRTGGVEVVSGLRACHHSLSGEAEFQPEQAEIALHGDDFRRAPTLSLVPLEVESWRQQETRDKLEQGLIKPRGYGFDVESKEDDIWERSRRVGTVRPTRLEERLDARLLNRRGVLRQRDVSATGLGASCEAGAALGFRVGDLVRVLETGGQPAERAIAVVCWLRHVSGSEIALGLNRIEGEAEAVAVRGLEGVGAESEYHRALRIASGEERMLAVPAGIFDLGSTVLINTGRVLEPAVLRRIMQSTNAFTLYAVEMVECAGERRRQVLDTLYKVLARAAE